MMKRLVLFVAIALLATGAYADKLQDYGNQPPDHSNCFTVPAGTLTTPQITEDFEAGVPPAGWTVECGGTMDNCWTTTGSDSCLLTGNWSNGSGLAACSNTDFPGSSTVLDTSLVTDCYDYTGASNSAMTFTANYRDLASGQDFFDVDYSVDGGLTWNNLLSWDETHGTINGTPGEDVNLDVSVLDGAAGAQIRYHYYDNDGTGWDWYIVVDDVVLEADGVISDGGNCAGGGDDGGGGVPATTGIGIALLVLLMGGGSAYFLRRK
jgi:hypothetical protein